MEPKIAVWSMARWVLLAGAALFVMVTGLHSCTRVETGEVGLRKGFDGKVDPDPLPPGFHQSIVGHVLIFSAREVAVPVRGLHPVTKDKLPMQDVDVQFTYKVNPASIPALYTRYSASYNTESNGEVFLMQGLIEQFVRSAVSDAIAKYAALEVNDKRPEIVGLIQEDVAGKIRTEGLDKDVSVGQIIFTNVSIPQAIVDSTQAVVKAQNDAKAAEFAARQAVISAQGTADAAVIQAKGNAAAITAQSQAIQAQGGEAYIRLKAIEKWDGRMPAYLGSQQPLPFVGSTSTKGGQ